MTEIERVLARLEALAGRLEGLLGERGPAPQPDDPQAVEAAAKYIKKRKWEQMKDAGMEEPYDA